MIPGKFKQLAYSPWKNARGSYYMLALLSMGIFIVAPLVGTDAIPGIVAEVLFILVLVTGVFSLHLSQSAQAAALLLLTSAILARSLSYVDNSYQVKVADTVLTVFTLFMLAAFMTKQYLTGSEPLQYRITGAVAIYLLLGLLFARVFEFLFLLNPQSFNVNPGDSQFSLLYFSFITLLTVGYGDIVPLSHVARTMAMLEGIVGQLYIVLLISSLVSEFSNQAVKSKIDLINKK